MTSSVDTYTQAHAHVHTHIYIHIGGEVFLQVPCGLFVKKLQPKVDLAGYDIFFAYFVVEAITKNRLKSSN